VAFVPFTGELDPPKKDEGFKFVPFTGQLDAQPAPIPAQRDATAEASSLVSPEEITAIQPSSAVSEDEGFFARNYRYAKDALISGFESMRASSKGIAFATARGYIQSFEREYGGPGVPLAPPDVKEEYEKYRAEAVKFAQDIAKFQKEAKERQDRSPLRPETARLKAAIADFDADGAFLESAKEAGAALISNPVAVIADLGAESVPAMAYMVSTSLLARLGLKSPTAGAVGGGVGSAISQFGNEYVERLQKGESHDEAWKNAAIRSGVIGTFDAISLKTAGTAAGKIVEALKTNKPATVAAKEFTKEMGKQAGLGGAGEAAGSLAIGEVPNPAAVIAEAAGELVTGPFEAVGAYQKVKQTAQDQAIADIERQLNKASEERLQQEETLRNAFATGFKQMYGRDATDEELDQMVETYEQRKMATGVVGPNVTGRIEPSFQAPGEAVTGEGVAATPTEPGAAGVAVPGVPTDVAGVGAAPQPSPLTTQFTLRSDLTPQEKASVRHYQELQRQPNNPVTQSLTALDTSIQKARDAYADIAAQLNIPSGKDVMGLGVQLPEPLGKLLNYPSTAGSAVRLVNASKDLTAGNKRGSQAKVDSAIKQVQGNINEVDQIIANAVSAAEDPAVQAQVNKLNEQLAVNKGVAARQSEVANLPLKERVAALKKIEDEVRAGLKTEAAPTQPPATPTAQPSATPTTTETEVDNLLNSLVNGGFKPDGTSIDERKLTRKMVAKVIDDGLAAGKSNEEILKNVNRSTRDALNIAGVHELNKFIDSKRGKKPPATPTAQPPAAAPIGLPEGMNDAQFLDAATKLQAGKVGAVKFQTLKALRDSGLALSNNSLSLEGEALFDQLTAAKELSKTKLANEDFAIDTQAKAIDSVFSDPNTNAEGIPTNEQAAEVQHMDTNAKQAMQGLVDDFMVGDQVRYGNVPGNIVGLDGDYVRFRPLKATSPKAYTRVPKNKITFESRPTGGYKAATSSAGDKKFTERQGQLNADMDNLLQNLGQSMYGSGITDVAVKELLQNAFDTVKEAVFKKVIKGIGHIHITLNEKDRTITVEDDGMGMTSDIVDKAFFTIAGTEKDVPPELASGGYGFAKVAFMTSTESISLDTVREGVRNTTSATASEIRRSQFKIKTAPAPKTEHGTKVVVKIPESYTDQKGEKQSIWFKTRPKSIQALTKPLVGPVEIKVTSIQAYGEPETTILQTGANFDYGAMPLLTKVNFDWGTADIYYAINRADDPSNPNHYVLSSGVYQFKGTQGNYGRFMLNQDEPIPFDIVVDVKSKVKPQDAQYPFTTSREAFRPSHEADVKALIAYLQQVARGVEAEGMQEAFRNIVSMPRVEVGADLAKTADKLKKVFDKRRTDATKFELPPMPKEVTVRGQQVFDLKGTLLADAKPEEERKVKESFKAEKDAPQMEQFLLNMTQDPKQPVFHNNTNVDFLAVGRPFGNPEQFFAELGSLFVEMKETIAKSGMYGYDRLDPKNLWFTGISVDKKYGGVSILVPYKANYLNPFYDWGAKSLFGVRENFLNTMIHELGHVVDRSHGVGHNNQMLRIQQYLADEGLIDYYRDALLDVLVRHESTFTAMRDAYGRSTTKNIAKSLEDYEGGTASISTRGPVSGSEYAPAAVSARERPRRGGDIRPASPTDKPSELTAGVDKLIEIGMQSGKFSQPVLEELINDNITGALNLLASRTKGFYGDLARVLADLNLPTRIVLTNPGDLILRQINELVRPQQFRLFDYVQRTYPDIYNKYFQNYDRAENLEKVYEGLQLIKSRNLNMAPVIAEFEDVLGTYNRNIKGLVVPGFYAPEFDAIYLDLNRATNDVLLHEVLHAATAAIIDADLDTLTPGQRAAIEQLNDMFEYAKKQIPLNLYGFTDLHEFVSELFTNKAFRDRLQKIQYKPTKQPLFTAIAKAIYRIFGINNLAGNAMAQATQLFSAVRAKKPLPIGIRFAKAPRKARAVGPTTGNWRAQEDYGTSVIELMNKMLKSGKPWPEVAKKVGKALFRAKYSQTRRLILPNLGLRHLADLTRFSFPQLTGAVRIIEQMLAYRFRSLTKAGDIVRDWTKLMQISAPMERLMSRVMVEATIRKIDPDTASAATLPPTDPLAKAWALLPPEFKFVYRRARDYYKDSINETINEMKQRIAKSGKPLSERKALLRDLNRQFGPDKLVNPYFPLRRFGPHWFQVGKGNFKEFVEFENEETRNLAMDVRRDELIAKGRKDLADTIQSGSGISDLYTKNAASTKLLGDVQQLIDNVSSTSTLAEAKENLKNSLDQLLYVMLPQQSMRKMFINRQAVQGASADMLRVFAKTSFHTAYQLSRFKYAEKFLANLATAREYVDEKFKGSPNGAAYRDFLLEVERRNPQLMSNEDESMLAVLSGKVGEVTFFFMLTAPATALVNVIGFPQLVLTTLGGDYGYVKASKLMLNHMRQYMQSSGKRTIVPLATGNILQARFPSMFESGLLNPMQQRAANVFMLENDVNISLTSEVMNLSDKPSALYTGTSDKIKRAIVEPLHQTERMMREVGLLTAFELAYDKLKGDPKRDLSGYILRDASGQPIMRTPDELFEDAIQEARDKIGLTLGDFNRQMKPRTMAIPGLNILFIFKTFAIFASYAIGRNSQVFMAGPLSSSERNDVRSILEKDLKNAVNAQQIIDGRMKEIDEYLSGFRKEAWRRLAGIFGVATILGGLQATPFFSIIGGILASIFGPGDDEDEFFDWENWFHNYCEKELGGYAANVLESMGVSEKTAEKYGKDIGISVARGPLGTFTGTSLTDRISIDLKNMWIRDPRYARDSTRQEILEGAVSVIGPAAGLAMNWADAYDLFQEGQIGRAMEKALPAFMSKPITAHRLATEGGRTAAGEELIAEFSAWEIAVQAVGIQPERLAKVQKAKIEVETYKQKIQDKRNAIMDRLWMEDQYGTSDGYEKAMEMRDKFNNMYPDRRISPKDISESFKRRRDKRKEVESFGANVPDKLKSRVDPMLEYGRRAREQD